MAPLTRARHNTALAHKIATLQLTLQPLVPLPSGPPHPAFPKNLLAFHLLTEDELDSIAHHYHQSTPGPWTLGYPVCMNWDKEFLRKRSLAASTAKSPKTPRSRSGQEKWSDMMSEASMDNKESWLKSLMEEVQQQLDLPKHLAKKRKPSTDSLAQESPQARIAKYAKLSDSERISIKRRKVGKFIGLVGMETPAEEIVGRIQASLERAVERARSEQMKAEEAMLRRRKVG